MLIAVVHWTRSTALFEDRPPRLSRLVASLTALFADAEAGLTPAGSTNRTDVVRANAPTARMSHPPNHDRLPISQLHVAMMPITPQAHTVKMQQKLQVRRQRLTFVVT